VQIDLESEEKMARHQGGLDPNRRLVHYERDQPTGPYSAE